MAKAKFAKSLRNLNQRRKQILFNLRIKKILNTNPVESDNDAPCEIFVLAHKKVLYMSLVMLKSLYFFSRQKFKINIITVPNGNFRIKDIDKIEKFVKNVNLICDEELIKEKLKNYPTCRKFYLDPDPSMSKLIGPALFATKKKVILLDSDVCFFRYPKFLIEWAHSDDPFNYYLHGAIPKMVTKALENDIKKDFFIKDNTSLSPDTGILLLHKEIITLDMLEEIFKTLQKHSFLTWPKEVYVWGIFLRKSEKYKPLPPEYTGTGNFGAACNHFLSRHHLLKSHTLKISGLLHYILYKEKLGEAEKPC